MDFRLFDQRWGFGYGIGINAPVHYLNGATFRSGDEWICSA
jgi:hypothetical protein